MSSYLPKFSTVHNFYINALPDGLFITLTAKTVIKDCFSHSWGYRRSFLPSEIADKRAFMKAVLKQLCLDMKQVIETPAFCGVSALPWVVETVRKVVRDWYCEEQPALTC